MENFPQRYNRFFAAGDSAPMKGLFVSLRAAAIFVLAAALCLGHAPGVGPANAQRYLADVKTLTQDKMEGRGDGSKGLTRAEHFLQTRYKSLGLEPAGTKGYLQPFVVVTGAKTKSRNHVNISNGQAKSELKLNQDFVPFSFSQSGMVSAPLVFAGYGVSAEEFGYDDYAGLDVKDKIVVVLRYEPATFATKTSDHGLTHHSQLITKAINARNHGAKGLILFNGKLGDGEQDLLMRFGSVSGPQNVDILFAQVKNDAAGKWFELAGKSWKDVQREINSNGKPASFAFPSVLQATLAVDIETTHARVNNVLAYLPGKTDEYIILGAHYDHLGRGNFDSLAPSQIGQIHPGADDNASGTSGLLELARLFAPLKGQLQRGILFSSFAGEELGLLGSSAWVKSPTKPLSKAVAMLNMDMIGRIKNDKVYVGGVGTGSTFEKVLQQAQGDSHLQFELSQAGNTSSDHTSYVTQKIPALFFFSGLHSDYHKPSDTWERINAEAAARLLDVVASTTLALDDAPDRPIFAAVVDTNQHAGSVPGGGSGYGPYFGSVPDFGQTENGVKFSDVKPGSPAAKAGLMAGDVLVRFGDKPIKNLYDFTDALRRSRVGDVVLVTVLRNGKELKVEVKLEQRK
jgi:hypothetical protein